MNNAILAHDENGKTVPYMLSVGTDAKAFAKLGIRCFGFAPLQQPPPDLDFAALFHGVDERVPVDPGPVRHEGVRALPPAQLSAHLEWAAACPMCET